MASRQFAESMSYLHKEMATLKKSNNALSEEVTALRGRQLKTEEQAVKRKSSAENVLIFQATNISYHN